MAHLSSHTGPRWIPLLLAGAAVGLIVGGIASGLPSWGWVAVALGVVMGLGIGYGVVVGSWLASLIIAVLGLSGAMVVAGAFNLDSFWGAIFIAAGLLGLIMLALMAVLVDIVRRSAAHGPHPGSREGGGMSAAADRAELQRLATSIHMLHDMVMLSEEVKRVIYGDRDHEVLRSNLEARLHAGDFDAARKLCEAIDAHFGERDDASDLRLIIDEALAAARNNELQDALTEFDASLHRRDWAAARAEADRLRTLWPDMPAVAQLSDRISAARAQHKQQLEAQFQDASARDDVEGAMRLLKELDRYMTRDEATRLSEAARTIIERHREMLSTSFRVALREKRWAEAARWANQIITEFPNSKMANEVRSMIPVLHTRATQEAIMSSVGD